MWIWKLLSRYCIKKEIEGTLLRPVNIDRGVVFCGYRHPHCMYTMVAVTGLRSVTIAPDAAGESVQGFLTSYNRFVDRAEAAKIFTASTGKQPKYSTIELYSEDLYLLISEQNPERSVATEV
jgi:hypothetical protein